MSFQSKREYRAIIEQQDIDGKSPSLCFGITSEKHRGFRLKAGEQYGIRRLDHHAYMMNHTEDGFPQAYYHFPYPWDEDKGFAAFPDRRGAFPLQRLEHPSACV
jgi:hypothetical protein